MNHAALIKACLEKQIFLSPDLLDEELDESCFENIPQDAMVVSKDLLNMKSLMKVNWREFEKAKVMMEKKNDPRMYERFMDVLAKEKPKQKASSVQVVFSYDEPSHKRTFEDFVGYFTARYSAIESLLKNRPELQRLTSINRVIKKKEKESVAVIGLIYEKTITKNEHVLLTLEDPTGFIKVLVSKNKPEIYDIARNSCLDEVVGITGTFDQTILFANNFFIPDVPLTKELKKSPNEEYLVLVGDPQLGSKNFLDKEFNKFLHWIQGKVGNDEQKAVARKVKYLIIPGDLVEGIGVYPGQEEDLLIYDIKEQYDAAALLLKQIPEHIQIIICPGNHDAGRLAEPQPSLYKDFAQALWDLPNVTIVSNPSLITLGATETFPGIDVLIYHGGSMFYYAAEVEAIRSRGGIKKVDLIMKHMLQRRHLAAPHTSTVYIPDPNRDPLVIERIPDIFVTGHVHFTVVGSYRNVTLINASAWVGVSENQIRRGLDPQPARLPIINLQSREVKIMNFMGKEHESK
ncbi:hypothetical protein C4573_00840 [Candidatus Woesearchaeota archaeon]|nr:MAG: hypothetical protein C4573_00840 [Candidatus Woesearchaeota archaeon]